MFIIKFVLFSVCLFYAYDGRWPRNTPAKLYASLYSVSQLCRSQSTTSDDCKILTIPKFRHIIRFSAFRIQSNDIWGWPEEDCRLLHLMKCNKYLLINSISGVFRGTFFFSAEGLDGLLLYTI